MPGHGRSLTRKMYARVEPARGLADFWSVSPEDLLRDLRSTPQGLSVEEARQRVTGGPPRLRTAGRGTNIVSLLLAQFKSPIVLILLFAAVLSLFLGEASDALIILAIVLGSGLLGFWQEWRAADALEKLLALVQIKATVLRDGQPLEAASQKQ